jgi:hypothetical protein
LSGLTFRCGEVPLAKQVGAEAGELVVPDAALVLARVCLRERFSARSGPLARARGHAITVVAQFVQEDVQELEGPCLTFRPLDQPVAARPFFHDHPEQIKHIAVFAHERGVGSLLPEFFFPGTDMDDAGLVPAHTVAVRCKHDRVQPGREFVPVGNDLEEALDISSLEQMSIGGCPACRGFSAAVRCDGQAVRTIACGVHKFDPAANRAIRSRD